MIKLGETYFDEASIIAVSPAIAPGAKGPAQSYSIHVAGEQFYRWEADADEVQRTLEDLGMVAPQSMSAPAFAVSELAELGACLSDGYNYAAKDEDGRVYAFEQAPAKGKKSWLNDDDKSRIVGLAAGEYSALSFADESPLDIAVALEGVLRC